MLPFLAFMTLTGASEAVTPIPPIIPEPKSLTMSGEPFLMTPLTKIVAEGEAVHVARLLQKALSPATGLPLDIVPMAVLNTISLKLDPELARLGQEGYTLKVSRDSVDISAYGPAGLFYGTQTLRQLLPTEAFRRARVGNPRWEVPGVVIEDQPRFAWRGVMVDVARHYQPKEFLFKMVDLLAMHKMNRLHLHLTEDQGWRIQIHQYPRLTEVGAWRRESPLGHASEGRFDGKPHGGYYTQDELRELVQYAKERFITVMPEIEMPGHAQAAIAAYPELGNTGEQLEVGTRWGVYDNVFNVEYSTIEFLQNVLDEVMLVFPSEFIHIGGDEVPKTQWRQSERAQYLMRQRGLQNEYELQSWFIKQMDTFLEKRGRRLVGWDEILEGGLAPGATVMSWRGKEGGIRAANMGHDVVMAPTSHTYFDYYQSQYTDQEPVAIGGFLPLETVYQFEPIPEEIAPERRHHVLGAQGQLWSEYIPNPKHMEYMAFPRASALAEVVWSPADSKNYEDFLRRLRVHLVRLQHLDVNYRRLD